MNETKKEIDLIHKQKCDQLSKLLVNRSGPASSVSCLLQMLSSSHPGLVVPVSVSRSQVSEAGVAVYSGEEA